MGTGETQNIDWEQSFRIFEADFSPDFAAQARELHEKQPNLAVFQVMITTRERLSEDVLLQLQAMNAQHFGPVLPWEPGYKAGP